MVKVLFIQIVKGAMILAFFLTQLPLVLAVEIVNPSFENGWEGWTDGDPTGSGTSISAEAKTGQKSVKLSEDSTFVTQKVELEANTTYLLKTYISGAGNLGVKVDGVIFFEQQTKTSKKWRELEVAFGSGEATSAVIFGSHAGKEVRFDDFSLTAVSTTEVETSARIMGGFGLSPDLAPGRNFDLLGWYLNTPADEDNDEISDRFSELELAKGAVDERYFYTSEDGGMVLRATVGGATTSKNTRFARTEFREMLRRGNTEIKTKLDGKPNRNNWVLSSAPESAQKAAGGVDGTLRATLAVNHVTTTGKDSEIGRVIIGQVHAGVDEPLRLYYRKLPESNRGSIYAAHEVSGGDNVYFDLFGDRSSDARDPLDGVELDEVFSYEIRAEGNTLYVAVTQPGFLLGEATIDMSGSGYDVADDYLYFKAGAYNQNASGDPEDYVQVTFYELQATHNKYEKE